LKEASSALKSNCRAELKKIRSDLLICAAGNRVINPPITASTAKGALGFNHPFTCRFLVPMSDVAAYDANPDR
jgi:hypothetical protein